MNATVWREYWLVHPVDRVLTIYRWLDGEYGKPELYELRGETAVSILPNIVFNGMICSALT